MKPLKEKLLEFVKENKIWVLSVAVPLLGAIPLYIYSMSVGELPDFSLGDLSGALIASFLTEMVIATVTVGYLLFAGFAARNAVNAFYPETPSGPPANHSYLIRGNFIQGVTVFFVLAWFGLVTRSFDTWLVPPAVWLARTAYWSSFCSSALLVIFDWRKGKRWLKYALLSILTGSIAFLSVLVCASLLDYIPTPAAKQGSHPPSSAPLTHATTWAADAGTWLLHDHPIATATIAALVAGSIASYMAKITRGRRQANRSGHPTQPFFKNERLTLLAAKAWITLVFCFLSTVTIVFLGVPLVDATPTHAQTAAAAVGGSFLILLNWLAFTASDWKQRSWAGVATFLFVFVILPLQSNNATLLPRMVVSALGSGNRHATNVVFASTECPALAPYGINCKSEKDSSIGITDVNILNRVGSTMLIELQVQRVMDTTTMRQEPRPNVSASEPRGAIPLRTNLVPLTLRAPKTGSPNNNGSLAPYPCDPLRLERLRAVDPAKADSLACVKLSVPKDHILGHTVGGAATYLGDFSKYVQIAP